MSGAAATTKPAALRALEAQRLLDLIAIKAMPALAAGIITYLHMSEVGSAMIVAGAMFTALRCGYGGSDVGTAWKLCHDLFYVKRRSLLADWLILVETAFEATRDAHRALRAPRKRFIVGEVRD